MHLAARVRWTLARRPGIYWAFIAVLAAAVAYGVHTQHRALDHERATWGATRTVLVADHDLQPGDPIAVSSRSLPVAVLPAGALETIPADGRLRQRVGRGEILVELDVLTIPGPAARAPDGSVVVEIAQASAGAGAIGLAVHVAADGAVIAEGATIVDVHDTAVYVAVDASDGAAVAAAAHADVATILYVP